MGNSSSAERQASQQAASASAVSSACPVVEQQPTVGGAASGAPESECPVPEQYRGQAVYNVYNQRIDPATSPAGAYLAATSSHAVPRCLTPTLDGSMSYPVAVCQGQPQTHALRCKSPQV